MLIQITNISELENALIIQDINTNIILSMKRELKRATAT